MAEPTLISDGLGAGIISAIGIASAGFITFLKWAVSQWLSERKQERGEMLTDRKQERDERAKDRDVLTDVRLDVQSLVLQSTRRDQRRRETEQPATRRVARGEFDQEESTDIVEIQKELRKPATRKPTPPVGWPRQNTKAEDR